MRRIPRLFAALLPLLAANAGSAQVDRTLANDPYAARLFFGVGVATGELAFSLPPNPCLGGPMPLCFGIYYASLLDRTVSYPGSLDSNWRGSYDWRLSIAGSTAEIEDHQGAVYRFAEGAGGSWLLVEPTDYPHQLAAAGSEWVFKHGESLYLYFFDASTGRLTRIEDIPGNQHTLTYDGSGWLVQVSDVFGRMLTFTVDRGGRTTQVTDGTRTVVLTYTGDLLTGYTDPNGETTTFAYATSHPIPGLLTAIQDPTVTSPYQYSYDSSGRVVTVVNAKSVSFGLSYGTTGETVVTVSEGGSNSFTHALPTRLTRHVDAGGGITTWTYDSQGRVTDVSGSAPLIHTTYDAASGYPSTITYPGGAEYQFSYVARSRVPGITWHRLGTVIAPDLTRLELEYDAVGDVSAFTDQAGQTWRILRNAHGQPTQVTNPAGGVEAFGYDAFGRLLSRSFGSDVTAYSYDALDRPVTITQPDFSTRSFSYDAMNRILTATDELAKTWTFAYRANGLLASIDDPLAQTNSFMYDNMGWLTQSTDELGHSEQYEYDNLGRLVAAMDRTSRTWIYSYDVMGRLVSSTDPGTSTTSFDWDSKSRLTSILRPLGRTTSFSYDARDRLSSWTDPLQETTTYTYDGRNRLIGVAAALGHAKSYGYDPRGLVQSAQVGTLSALYTYSPLRKLDTYTDGRGESWTRTYDNRGRLTSQTDPLSRTETFTYDSRDRLTGFTCALGTAAFQWDAAGRLTERSYSDGTVHRYTYDGVGRLLTTEGVTRAYDALGRLVQENGISFGYDAASRRSSQSFGPGLMLTYDYDPRGLLSAVHDWTGRTTRIQYDAAGRRTALVGSNGLTTSYVYDAADRLARWSVADTESMASATVQHDALGRVKLRFPWNRSAGVTPTITTATYSHDAASQIVGFTYDGLGRLLNDGMRTYAWDLASRLTGVTEAGRAVTFRYDGLDRAYETTADGVVTIREFGHAFGAGPPAVTGNEEVWNQPLSFYDLGRDALREGPQGGLSSGHEVGHWLGLYHSSPSGTGGTHEVGHWFGVSSGAPATPLYFPGKLKVSGNPLLYMVTDTRDQLLYTIGHLNGAATHHHIDDLGNVSFLSDEHGSAVTHYGYSPSGETSTLGWIAPAPRFTYRASASAVEESPTGLYRIGTDLYDARVARKRPGRLTYAPPAAHGNKLYVGNLSYDTSAEADGAILVVSAADGPMPARRKPKISTKCLPVGSKSAVTCASFEDEGATAYTVEAPGGIVIPPDPVRWGVMPEGAAPDAAAGSVGAIGTVVFRQGSFHCHGMDHDARYHVTGARHVYMPSGEGFKTLFRLGTAAPPQTVVPPHAVGQGTILP